MEAKTGHSSARALIDLLLAERCSCVIRSRDEIRIFRERGVKDLYHLLCNRPEFLRDAFVADKVVGKAAAALMMLGGVRELHAEVISRQALELLSASDMAVTYHIAVPYIINRSKSGWCPLENRCRDLHTAEECLVRIEDFIRSAAP